MIKRLLLLPGDGIGPEVVGQARRVVEWFIKRRGLDVALDEAKVGGAAYDAHGMPLPKETFEKARAADAILLGAVGGPKYDTLAFGVRPERALLSLRKELGLFANLRPAITFEALVDASTLKPEYVRGLDILIVRELTGGIYFGEPRGVETLPDGSRRGVNTEVYTSYEVERIARVAFELARKRRNKLCSVDKSNVMESTLMWREEVIKLHAAEFRDVELSHLLVDNAAMQLVRNPKQFDVVVTTNIFGDILSDIAAQLTGSLGMLPSASLGAKGTDGRQPALYEPAHGSAPDIAGQGVANPIATILSFGMMLRYSFDRPDDAERIDRAVEAVLNAGLRTGDIMQEGKTRVTTRAMGDAILLQLERLG